MKKVLLASTMLVATGGMAAADITFNGFGRFGVTYDEGNQGDDAQLEQRFRLNIVGTAETDGGVRFGARLRIETNDNARGQGQTIGLSQDDLGDLIDDEDSATINGSQAVRAPEFNVQYGGFRLDAGNTSDVLDSGDVVDYYGYGIGLNSFLEQSSAFGLPASGISDRWNVDPTVKARYSFGDFTVAASITNDAGEEATEEWQVGAGYKFGNFSVGGVYGNTDPANDDDDDFWAVSFAGSFGQLGFSLLAAERDGDSTGFGGSVSYPIGAATEIRGVVQESGVSGADTAYGVGFRHSLGGGVSLRGGIANDPDGDTAGDLGVIFDF